MFKRLAMLAGAALLAVSAPVLAEGPMGGQPEDHHKAKGKKCSSTCGKPSGHKGDHNGRSDRDRQRDLDDIDRMLDPTEDVTGTGIPIPDDDAGVDLADLDAGIDLDAATGPAAPPPKPGTPADLTARRDAYWNELQEVDRMLRAARDGAMYASANPQATGRPGDYRATSADAVLAQARANVANGSMTQDQAIASMQAQHAAHDAAVVALTARQAWLKGQISTLNQQLNPAVGQ